MCRETKLLLVIVLFLCSIDFYLNSIRLSHIRYLITVNKNLKFDSRRKLVHTTNKIGKKIIISKHGRNYVIVHFKTHLLEAKLI